MTEREMLLASLLIFSVLFFVVALFIIGQMPLVLVATAGVEIVLRRLERARSDLPPQPFGDR